MNWVYICSQRTVKSWIALWGWMQLSLSVSVRALLCDLTSWCCWVSCFSAANTHIIKEILKVESEKGGWPSSQASSLLLSAFLRFSSRLFRPLPHLIVFPGIYSHSCCIPLSVIYSVHKPSAFWLLKPSPSVVRSSFSPPILLPAAAQWGWTISRRRARTVWEMVEDYEKKKLTCTLLLQTAAVTQWDSWRISMHTSVWICMIILQVVDLNVLLGSKVRIIVF